MRVKYLIYDNGVVADTPIIFPVWITHSEMAQNVALPGKVVSAGFVEIYGDHGQAKCSTYGESVSMKLKPGENDAELIAKVLLGGDI